MDTQESSKKKSRTVDYTRTDKRPHSFRYKRGTAFAPRLGSVTLTKETDGAFVIVTSPEADELQDATKLETGAVTLVSVKKRANGKTAITFKHDELGEVICYDARVARAALRVGE